eukprot:m.478996 g.478996  ORF g.478996 m.478996 type:complete len:1143 (+) comp21295_c0_seq1:295-3723(+)
MMSSRALVVGVLALALLGRTTVAVTPEIIADTDSITITAEGNITFTSNGKTATVQDFMELAAELESFKTASAVGAPVFVTSATLPTAVVGVAYDTTIEANQADGNAVSFSMVGGSLPSGLSFSATNPPKVSGTPAQFTSVTDTVFSITVRATDSVSQKWTSKDFTITLVDPDACDSNPCGDNGACIDRLGGHLCQCQAGYTGAACETKVMPCDATPCTAQGTCVNINNGKGYRCDCDDGFTGSLCELEVDDCGPSPCQNGGTCTDGDNTYTCTCPSGYEGDMCETKVDFCDGNNDCLNGATCVSGETAFECQCATGFFGALCASDVNECDPDPCQNGVCSNVPGSFQCVCEEGYSGPHCDMSAQDCQVGPWENDGDGSCTAEPCGSMLQRRRVTQAPVGDGAPCPMLLRSVPCAECLEDALVNVARSAFVSANMRYSTGRSEVNLNDGYTDFLGLDWLTPNGIKDPLPMVVYDLLVPLTIVSTALYNQNEYSHNSREVSVFNLESSDDGNTWTAVLMNQAMGLSSATRPNPRREFTFAAPVTARYFRLTLVDNQGADNDYWGLMEWELLARLKPSYDNQPDLATPELINWARTAVVSASSSYNSRRFVRHLIDGWKRRRTAHNYDSDWITAKNQNVGATVTFDFGEPHEITIVNIWNQMEYADSHRDVKTIMLQFSDDGTTWADAEVIPNIPATGGDPRLYKHHQLATPRTARWFRIRLDEAYGNDGYWGLHEVELVGPNKGQVHYRDATAMIAEAIPSSHYLPTRSTPLLFDGKTEQMSGASNWISQSGKRDGMTATLVFEEPIALRRFIIWNNDQVGSPNRCAKDFSIGVKTDMEADTQWIFYGTLEQTNPDKRGNMAQDYYIPTTVGAAPVWVLRLDTFWASDSYGGLMELKVFDDPIASTTHAAITAETQVLQRSLTSLVGRPSGVPVATAEITRDSVHHTTLLVSDIDVDAYGRPMTVRSGGSSPLDMFVLENSGDRPGELDVLATGRLGVGTFQPDSRLHVKGTFKLDTGTSSSTSGLRMRNAALMPGFGAVGIVPVKSTGLYMVQASIVARNGAKADGYATRKWYVRTGAGTSEADTGEAQMDVVPEEDYGNLCDLSIKPVSGYVSLVHGCASGETFAFGSIRVEALVGDNFAEF